MAIKLIDDRDLWDDFIDKSPYGLLFHKWDFLKTVEKHSGFRLLPYGIYKGDELICVFPAFFGKNKGLKFVYSPAQLARFYVPYLGFVMSPVYPSLKQRRSESYLNFVAEEINKELAGLTPNYISISMMPGFMDMRPFKWDGYDLDVHYTYVLDISRPIEEVWSALDKDCKQAIRKYQKYDLSIKKIDTLKDDEDIDLFYNMMKSVLSKEGLHFFQRNNLSYFKDVLLKFPKNIETYFLYYKEVVVSIYCVVKYKDTYLLWAGAGAMENELVNEEHSSLNDYMCWELIKMAKAEGYTQVENWGADVKRLTKFKAKYNPSLKWHYTLTKKDNITRMAGWMLEKIVEVPNLNFLRIRI